MKYLFLFLLFFTFSIHAQEAFEADLLFHWDDPEIPGSSIYNNAYNECWGVVANNREIAIIGSTLGTHFFDVTDENNILELPLAFVPGATQGGQIIHRDYHDYQCYLYAVADEGSNSTLQIIDISNLPYTTEVLYDSNVLFTRAHNIFIDTATAKLYACAVKANSYYQLAVYSLANPLNPSLLDTYGVLDGVAIPTIHDIYVRNDIAFMNGSNSGLFIADFSDMNSPQIITQLSTYPYQGYNHSGWLTDDGNYYYMADETHGMNIKVLDVSDLNNIEVVNTFTADSTDSNIIPHNLIVRGRYLYTSYYYDGMQIFDITDPVNPRKFAYYDTYPGTNNLSYEGAWGIFPYFPSGKTIVSDMQTGLYVFQKTDASISTTFAELGSYENCTGLNTSAGNPDEAFTSISLFPQPFSDALFLDMKVETSGAFAISMTDPLGRKVMDFGSFNLEPGENSIEINVDSKLSAGLYLITISGESGIFARKVIKQ